VVRWNGKQLNAKKTKLMGVSRNEVTVAACEQQIAFEMYSFMVIC
jgi:hypothetical protein